MGFDRTAVQTCTILAILAASGCDQGATRLTTPVRQELSVTATPIYVANVDQLYSAVNDAANAGATIIMAPGNYVLRLTDGAGAPRPNKGRLELQRDMSLYGVTGDRGAAVIDASQLPDSAFNVSFGRTAPVRIGRGTNSVEWLTIVGNVQAAAGIAAELTGTPTTHVKVAHVTAGGSSRGVDIRNVGAAMIGRRIDAEVIDDEFIGPTQVVGMTEGIRIANFVGANAGVIDATLSGNRTHGFQLGCILASNRSSNAVIDARSSGDRFYANALGCLITGGLSQATTGVANSNTTTFRTYGSQFVDDTAQISGIDPGGVRVVAGLSTVKADATSDNTVLVELTGTKVARNQVVDFEAYGAWKASAPGIAGTNNHATVVLKGVSKQIEVTSSPSLPADAGGTNTVTIIR